MLLAVVLVAASPAARLAEQLRQTDPDHGGPAYAEIARLKRSPDEAAKLFPELLDYLGEPRVAPDVVDLFLALCNAQAFTEEQKAAATPKLAAAFDALAKEHPPGDGPRALELEYLVDVLGHLPIAESESALRRALALPEPGLKYFAASGLIRSGREVPDAALASIAAEPAWRVPLYETLAAAGQRARFPAKFGTQEALAASEMCRWLAYPTELGRVPDEIELLKVVTRPGDHGPVDYYVFRFRTRPPHWAAKDGWLRGVAGGYVRSEEPTTRSLGGTFSAFEKWRTKSPEAIVDDGKKILDEWKKN